jgi:hypothetical protein
MTDEQFLLMLCAIVHEDLAIDAAPIVEQIEAEGVDVEDFIARVKATLAGPR